MAGNVRIRLVMADGTQVRGLEDLRQHFDLESVLGYYQDGKLVKWLRGLYMEEAANKVESLDEKAPDFQPRLCDVLGVVYTGDEADLEAIQRRKERLDRLRTVTDDPKFIQHVDQVAFDQEDLADLLDEGVETIYLCGGQFTVPAAVEHVHYIGINQPDVHIDGEITVPAEEFMQKLDDCKVDNPPHDASDPPPFYPIPEHVANNERFRSNGITPSCFKWNCPGYAFCFINIYGYYVVMACLVDKDDKIETIYGIWVPELPELTLEDVTEEQIAEIKDAHQRFMNFSRCATLATAVELAKEYFAEEYEVLVSKAGQRVERMRKKFLGIPDKRKWGVPVVYSGTHAELRFGLYKSTHGKS